VLKFEGPAPPTGRNIVSRKMQFGWVNMSAYNFLFVNQSSTFFSLNVGEVVIDQVFFRFSTGRSTREIFAIKVKSCQKSRRIFALPNFRGRAFPHNCAHLNTPASRHVAWKKFHDVTLTSRKVIGAHTLNFKPNFTCSPLNFWGDPRPRWGCALASLGQSVVRVKI